MREIKFRAWDKERNEMYDVDALHFYRQLIEVDSETDHQTTSIEPYEVMQYTGLKDKDGAEIYEGDIIQASHRSQRDDEITLIQEQVSFLNGCFMFGNWNAHEYFNGHRYIEIIGNIYENPELLGNNQ